MMGCDFKFEHYEEIFRLALKKGYQVITVKDFFQKNFDDSKKILINRLDVDFDCDKAKRLASIFDKLNVKGSFYFRLHGKYNIFSYKNFNILKSIVASGHEIGLHSEIVDMQHICREDPEELLKKEIRLFESFFDTKIQGVASHGDYTPYNNLDFWQSNSAEDFGLMYEAYDEAIWKYTRYVSDSLINGWKCYDKGVLLDDNRCACKHIEEGHQNIYLLTHPFCFYEEHYHDSCFAN